MGAVGHHHSTRFNLKIMGGKENKHQMQAMGKKDVVLKESGLVPRQTLGEVADPCCFGTGVRSSELEPTGTVTRGIALVVVGSWQGQI
jgi:hypothetical protein